jgi:hypothetical protein
MPNVFGSSLWNLLHVILLSPAILRWPLNWPQLYGSLSTNRIIRRSHNLSSSVCFILPELEECFAFAFLSVLFVKFVIFGWGCPYYLSDSDFWMGLSVLFVRLCHFWMGLSVLFVKLCHFWTELSVLFVKLLSFWMGLSVLFVELSFLDGVARVICQTLSFLDGVVHLICQTLSFLDGVVRIICQTLSFYDVAQVPHCCVLAQWAHRRILYSSCVQVSLYVVMTSDEHIGSEDASG